MVDKNPLQATYAYACAYQHCAPTAYSLQTDGQCPPKSPRASDPLPGPSRRYLTELVAFDRGAFYFPSKLGWN